MSHTHLPAVISNPSSDYGLKDVSTTKDKGESRIALNPQAIHVKHLKLPKGDSVKEISASNLAKLKADIKNANKKAGQA